MPRIELRGSLYKLRRQTVEPVFGVIKAVLGFAGFSLRGLEKVEGEWTLVALLPCRPDSTAQTMTLVRNPG